MLLGMSKPVITPQDTIQAILQRSNRRAVPIRKSFVRVAGIAGSAPLAELVRHHDVRALDLYLLVLAQASGGAFDVAHPAAVWARALHLTGETGAAAVSKVLARLVAYRLVARDRVGRRAHLTLLCEDGSGRPYTPPAEAADAYLQLPALLLAGGVAHPVDAAREGGAARRAEPARRLLLADRERAQAVRPLRRHPRGRPA